MSDMYFKSLPDKSTPLTPENLNKLNDIKVSPTEPTTGEKVWIKHKENLFDGNIVTGSLTTAGGVDSNNANVKTSANYIEVKPNTTYIFSEVINRICSYKSDQTIIERSSSYEITQFTTDANTHFVKFDMGNTVNHSALMLQEGTQIILPAIYTKNNANSYEKLIRDNDVAVSPVQPSIEKVWIQKGKNLSKVSGFGAINNSTGIYMVKAKVEPNETYTISAIKSRIEGVSVGNVGFKGICAIYAYDVSGNLISDLPGSDAYYAQTGSVKVQHTIETPTNADYIIVDFGNNNGDGNYNTSVSEIQVEQGIATPYEQYIEKAIYVKNDNGVYEPFYKESEMNKQNYSTEEQVIGTWIDEKPLYRKVVVFNDLLNPGDNLIPHGIQNLDKIIRCDLFTATRYLFPNSYNSNCYGSVYMVDTTNVNIHLINDNYGVGEKYIVIEYTKTTD